MAKQIEGVYEEVIEIAKREFLEHGFQKASLRTIATEANTTTGSIYTRFQDKEGLFSAIVEPTATDLLCMFTQIQESFYNFSKEIKKKQVGEYTLEHSDRMIDYMYEHFSECKLLVQHAQGTKYEGFTNRFIEIEEDYTRQYIDLIGCSVSENSNVDFDVIHMVTTAYFESFFEIVRHNMDQGSAKEYVRILGEYHLAGFKAVFHLD